MDGESANQRPLRERIRQVADELHALKKAIREELDWREKSHPIELDDWSDDEAV